MCDTLADSNTLNTFGEKLKMGIVKKQEASRFELDNEFYINFVSLEKNEAEHTHGFIELVYTLGGRGVHNIDGNEYCVKSGDMVIVNYNQRHTVIPTENLRYVDIMLKPEYVNKTLKGTEDLFLLLTLSDFSALSESVIRDEPLIHFDGGEKKKIDFLLGCIEDEQRSAAPAGEMIMRSSLSTILSLVFRKMSENKNVKLSVNNGLLEYMKRNCGSRILINQMAAKCGYSVEHFSRIFKRYTGKTPVSYLTDCRIAKAKKLLLNTDKPIESIIFECGFSNRTAFFKKFSEREGITPLKLRKSKMNTF